MLWVCESQALKLASKHLWNFGFCSPGDVRQIHQKPVQKLTTQGTHCCRSLERTGDTGSRSPQETSQRKLDDPWTGAEGRGELYTFDKLYSGTFSNCKFKVGMDCGICASLGANKYLVKCSRRMCRYRCLCMHTYAGTDPPPRLQKVPGINPVKAGFNTGLSIKYQASPGLE